MANGDLILTGIRLEAEVASLQLACANLCSITKAPLLDIGRDPEIDGSDTHPSGYARYTVIKTSPTADAKTRERGKIRTGWDRKECQKIVCKI